MQPRVSFAPVITALALALVLVLIGCGGSPDATSDEPVNSANFASGRIGRHARAADLAPGEDPPIDDPGGEGAAPDAGVDPASDAAPVTPPSDAGTTPPSDSGVTPPITTPASVLLAAEAKRELSIMKSSTYDHTTFVDESKGIFNYDCSGFIGYAMGVATPDAFKTITLAQGVPRPLAKDFEAFFASIPAAAKKGRWSRVPRAIDLVPGDVVAWLKPIDLASTNTGHVMIVHLAPYKNPSRPDEVIVPITDASASFHGSTDTRSPSGQGLGQGPIGLLIDTTSGAPWGYRWTGGYSSKDYTTEIALGHVD